MTSLVNLFIVGAAKSGTTSLWKYLSHHPDVFTTADELHKEPAFFSLHGEHLGLQNYHALYKEGEHQRYRCDASTAYLTSPESAQRIYDYNPQAKIIAVLRNPIDRAYSLYNWMVGDGYEWAPTFRVALRLEAFRSHQRSRGFLMPEYFWNYMYVKSGFYVEQVDRYTRLFGNSFKAITFERLVSDQFSATQELCLFLGISHNPMALPRENRSRRSFFPMATFAMRKLIDLRSRGLQYDSKESRDRLLSATLSSDGPPPLDNSIRLQLQECFAGEMEQLSDRYGIQFFNG